MFAKFKYKVFHQSLVIQGVEYSSYAEIELLNANGNVLKILKKGIVDNLVLLERFRAKRTIVLDNCFFENFDIQLFIEADLPIKSISANGAVFVSDYEINFSNIPFIEEDLSLKDAYFLSGDLNFSNSVLGRLFNDFFNTHFSSGNVDFSNTTFGKEKTNFRNAYFSDGYKNFQYANFNSGMVDFTNTHFGNGKVSFVNANFSQSQTSFKLSSFGVGQVDFHYAHFSSSTTSFEQVSFGKGSVDFSKVTFNGGKVNFNRSIFEKGDVGFEGVELLNGKMTFKKASLPNNQVCFDEANCKGTFLNFDNSVVGNTTFSFRNASFETLSFNSVHLDGYCDFRVDTLGLLNLQDCVVRDILDFVPFNAPVNINAFNLYGVRLVGKIFIDWEQNNVKSLIYRQTVSHPKIWADQFRILKENFHNNGEYSAEDKAYVEFKRCEAKAFLEQSRKPSSKLNKIFHSSVYYLQKLFLDKAGLYATSPLRVMLSVLFSYLFFSCLYVFGFVSGLGGFSMVSGDSIWCIWADSFYFSIVTYLTIGYGDFSPIGINKLFAGLEGFVGVFLMAYFSVAFVRRILR